MPKGIRTAFRLTAILLYALWGRITRTRERRVEAMESFTRSWMCHRIERFDQAITRSEADFLSLIWRVYVGPGGRDFARRTGKEVDRKLRWKQAMEGSPMVSDPV